MNTGFDPRVQLSHRGVDIDETARNLYFELGIGQMPHSSDSSQHPARDQVQRDAVRVVDDYYIVDWEAQLRSDRPSRLDRSTKFMWLHTVSFSASASASASAEYTCALGVVQGRLTRRRLYGRRQQPAPPAS
ncbi:hypothetical protein GCM10009540_38150 [Streptomyces turgidiscabies]